MGKNVVKKQPGFRITDAKALEVLFISSQMTVKHFYAAEGCRHKILKRGSCLSLLVAKEFLLINSIKKAQKREVLQLKAITGAK